MKNEVIHKYYSVVRNEDRKELYRLFYYRYPDSLYKRESFGEVDSIREYVFKKDLFFSEKLYCKGLDPLQKGYSLPYNIFILLKKALKRVYDGSIILRKKVII